MGLMSKDFDKRKAFSQFSTVARLGLFHHD